MRENRNYIRYITFLAAFGALAYLSVVFLKIPMIAFLRYEPKDIILTIGGIIFGPIFALILCVVVPFFEMITVSSTGVIGFVMNVIAAVCFVLPPVVAYKKWKRLRSLVIGLVLGIVALTIAMLLWNYVLTPLFFGYPRSTVLKMLVPIILPFNLIKGGLNAVFTLILYKPIVNALLKSNTLNKNDLNVIPNEQRWTSYTVILLIILTIVLLVLSYFKVV
ncbi:ECF transporter S component [Loigolactobacillus rennini]|uniref:Riboflavin transporter n=2 Tax=Loigolactobacillus rennini TaxID=238013 RepID=A0A0R2D2J9_9LACO|nr:ECF transporter S component [Loigolactobacillus rennini]KRM98415.1 hypothetical protein FC24_GL001300 [Loigolactobacillus rennini DSM 20253]SFZ88360.1 Substrate-specific component RibU of riboflavin ECF transporter [Loigolactobacillus rennini]